MRAVYFDCFAGVSGDMIIGAQLDLGVDLESLKQQVSSIGLDGYQIKNRRVERSGISASKFDVEVNHAAQPARTLADIRSLIVGSSTTDYVRDQAIRVFDRLAEAEARVHGAVGRGGEFPGIPGNWPPTCRYNGREVAVLSGRYGARRSLLPEG